jgi:orotidine-5'-phosphate decarboxylase
MPAEASGFFDSRKPLASGTSPPICGFPFARSFPNLRAMRNPIIVALDIADPVRALALARAVGPHVGAVKVGKELFVSAGPDIVRSLRADGVGVFLDLKFHDIPNTVAKAVAAATRLGVQMLTLHASGGSAMMRAAVASAAEAAAALGQPAPLLLGVTVLTSHDDASLAETGVAASVDVQVEHLARLAASSGMPGLVCSPLELPRLRACLPAEVQWVTPGIRTGNEKADDQRRTLSPREAMAAGATWLVVGRPIYAAPDPVEAARAIAADACAATRAAVG